MCTMISEKAVVKGSGKKTNNWIPIDSCDIYYDHSTYVDCEHSLTLSFLVESVSKSGEPSIALSP